MLLCTLVRRHSPQALSPPRFWPCRCDSRRARLVRNRDRVSAQCWARDCFSASIASSRGALCEACPSTAQLRQHDVSFRQRTCCTYCAKTLDPCILSELLKQQLRY